MAKGFERDDVHVSRLERAEQVLAQLPDGMLDSDTGHPHEDLGMRSPREGRAASASPQPPRSRYGRRATMVRSGVIHELLKAHSAVAGVQETLQLGGASAEWRWHGSEHGAGASTAQLHDTYEARGHLAARKAAGETELGRAGNWDAFLPALKACPFERVHMFTAHLPTGHFALAITDEADRTLVGVLVCVPDTRPPRTRAPWMGPSKP